MQKKKVISGKLLQVPWDRGSFSPKPLVPCGSSWPAPQETSCTNNIQIHEEFSAI